MKNTSIRPVFFFLNGGATSMAPRICQKNKRSKTGIFQYEGGILWFRGGINPTAGGINPTY